MVSETEILKRSLNPSFLGENLEVHLWIELRKGEDEKFIDELEKLCERFAREDRDGKDYYFTFKG